MEPGTFDRSSKMTPLLVRLYDSHKLYSLAKDGKPAARAELTQAVTDLFETTLTAREEELLADVLIGLMRQAERDLRRALAEKLSKFDNVPLRLVLHLANDEIAIATPILRDSTVLSDLDLIYIIKSQGPAYWQAIAARGTLSRQLVDILAETRDPDTALVLTKNERVALTRYALEILTDMAQNQESLARPLLMRPEIPEALARQLYEHVGADLKNYIDAFFGDLDSRQARKAADSLIVAFADRQAEEFMPASWMIRDAREKAETKHISPLLMLETLQKGKIPEFIAEFAEYTGISARQIHDFLRQPCPRGLVIACRAFNIQKSELAKFYLMTHRMRSKSRIISQTDMAALLQYFDRVRPETAMKIIRRKTVPQ